MKGAAVVLVCKFSLISCASLRFRNEWSWQSGNFVVGLFMNHCRALTAILCGVLFYCCVALCCVKSFAVFYCTVLCEPLLCCAVLCCVVLCCAVLCCAVLCCAVLCCRVKSSTVLCSAVWSLAVFYCALLCRAVVCAMGVFALLCSAVPCGDFCRGVFLACVVLCFAALCCCVVLLILWTVLCRIMLRCRLSKASPLKNLWVSSQSQFFSFVFIKTPSRFRECSYSAKKKKV